MSNGGASWRRFDLTVAKSDVAPAAALLETAARALTATELRRSSACVSVFVPRASARAAAARIRKFLARARRGHALCESELAASTVFDEDSAAGWKRLYRPQLVAPGLFVVPTWISDFRAPRGAKILRLDPGMAFGTGQHPSTRLALRLLLEHIRTRELLLDIGTGSGILALAAAQRGARVYASDMDAIAVSATRANFRSNDLTFAEVRRARGVPTAFPSASLIVSNITARVIMHLARPLATKLRRRGRLIVSGFTDRNRDAVQAALRAVHLTLTAEQRNPPWVAQVYGRP